MVRRSTSTDDADEYHFAGGHTCDVTNNDGRHRRRDDNRCASGDTAHRFSGGTARRSEWRDGRKQRS
jgi:hypothetical protein